MTFHVVTIFPEYFAGPFDHGVVARARKAGRIDIQVHDLRNWTRDRHKTVDDRPFGGGEGMLLKPEPLFEAVESIWPERDEGKKVVLLSAQGRLFTEETAERLGAARELLLICGRYEGVDERVAQRLADEELSIGDYVLSGGELAAAVVIDAVVRLLPGVLGDAASPVEDSYMDGLLDSPQYTRPEHVDGLSVPEVLLRGDHEAVRRWRLKQALGRTWLRRPQLLETRKFTAEERELLDEFRAEMAATIGQ
ncbi:MAG: tRNA (guanosine(37)-N1)-methyltransferase TrmD [Bryobacteraceae bacterium]